MKPSGSERLCGGEDRLIESNSDIARRSQNSSLLIKKKKKPRAVNTAADGTNMFSALGSKDCWRLNDLERNKKTRRKTNDDEGQRERAERDKKPN